MKRTKNNWTEGHPQDRNGISGLMTFDGEDVKYENRKKLYQSTQKEWFEQQFDEKQQRRQQEKQDEMLIARQTLQDNRAINLLEGQAEASRKMMQASVRDANLQMKLEKEARANYEREMKIKEEQADLQYQRDIRRKGAY